MDRHIITEWERLHERLCPQCQRPLALHRAEVSERGDALDPNQAASENYGVAFLTCPATLAEDRAQAAQAKADKPAHDAGLHPERARTWMTIRSDEQVPTFDD